MIKKILKWYGIEHEITPEQTGFVYLVLGMVLIIIITAAIAFLCLLAWFIHLEETLTH